MAKIRDSDKFLTCLADDFISQKAERARTETAFLILTLSSKGLAGSKRWKALRERNKVVLEVTTAMKGRLGLY